MFMLVRAERKRQSLVVISREALAVDPPRLLPVETRQAIQTVDRSDVQRSSIVPCR